MNRIKRFTLVALALGSVAVYAAQDRSFHVQNSVRVGYDDNVYLNSDNEQDTAFITDIINLSGTLTFSDRSDLELYWQPEFRYRFDADPEAITYQDLYAQLNHAVSQRAFATLSDRFRYQEKDGRSDLGRTQDQNYLENNLMGSVDLTINAKSYVRVGGGYEFRTWDDDAYGEWDGTVGSGNNYDQYRANGSVVRELAKDTTSGMVGVNYMDHEYDGARGGFNSTTIYGGVEHGFSPNLKGTAQLGYSFSSVESSTGTVSTITEDTSSPFFEAGLDYQAAERTSINGSVGYSLSQSQNSLYNASDSFDAKLGVKHDLTGKVSLSSALSYIFSMYDSQYTSFGYPDAEEDYIRLSIRGSYEITRNHFVDVGYEYTYRDSDSAALNEYTRNRIDFGWRMRL